MNWRPKDTETLRSMWESGCSAGVIAQHLSMTRDAVLGRARRMGLNRSGKVTVTALPTHPNYLAGPRRIIAPLPRESAIWADDDEDKRRRVFAARAALGARKTLEATGL
jgi:hypothetical protein